MIFRFVFPVKTTNPSNGPHKHWRASAAMRRRVREAVYNMAALDLRTRMAQHMPCIEVTYTRHSSKTMDDDNLRSALKPVRDAVAQAFGIDDGSVLFVHTYKQEKGPTLVSQVQVDVEVKCTSCQAIARLHGENRERMLRLMENMKAVNDDVEFFVGKEPA